jgi:hypothetical protein
MVPRLAELSAVNVTQEVLRDPEVLKYLPELKENKRSYNRDYLFTVSVHSLDQSLFINSYYYASLSLQLAWAVSYSLSNVDYQHNQAWLL